MTYAKARVVFATHMQAARQRKLTAYESKQLNTARQVLRRSRKPAMNAPRKRQTYTIHGRTYVGPKGLTPQQAERMFKTGKKPRRRQSNPRGTLIYGEVQTIFAKKSQNHICDDECKK